MGVDVPTIDRGFEIDHASGLVALQDHVVHRQHATRGAVRGGETRLEQAAFVPLEVSRQDFVQPLPQFRGPDIGEEPEAPPVDPHDGAWIR